MRVDRTLVFAAVLAGATAAAPAGEREDALLSAVRKGDLPAVKALLDQGVPVDTRFRYDRTALSFAADRGNLELVTLLLDRGADVNSQDTFYKVSPVGWAANKGHVEVVRVLLARGATATDGVFSAALRKANLEMLELALAAREAWSGDALGRARTGGKGGRGRGGGTRCAKRARWRRRKRTSPWTRRCSRATRDGIEKKAGTRCSR